MYLGVWWNPFSWFGDALDGVVSFFYGILVAFDAIIYSFISYLYQIFMVLTQGSKLIDDKSVGSLVGRIYIIIGVVMLFLIAYSLLKSMINPDEALKGKQSPVNIIKDVIISVSLIALLPTIFEFAFDFQNSLLLNNTIGKLIVGAAGSGTSDPAETIRKGGYIMAEGVYKAFLHAAPGYCDNSSEEDTRVSEYGGACEPIILEGGKTFGSLWDEARDSTTFWTLAQAAPKIKTGEVDYYFLIAPISGIFVLFVLIQYCLDMALRLVKLAVYEVIAPIPIFARIMPNEQSKKVFSNWLKATISTFTEVFIRIAILYFAIFVIVTITSGDTFGKIFTNALSGTALLGVALIAKSLVIIGIVLFVKQAPEIIKEITGLDGGKYGKSLIKGFGMMTATLGGGTTAMIRTAVNDKDHHGFAKGFNVLRAGFGAGARGLYHGNKVEKIGDIPKAAGTAASNTLAKRAKVQAAGGNLKYLNEWRKDKLKDITDWASGGFEAQQKILDQINAVTQNADAVKSKTEGFVRDKKYMFSMKDNGDSETVKYSKGHFVIDNNTSLSEIDSIIQTLKGTGDVADSQLADRLNNDMQIRIKNIGKKLSQVSTGDITDTTFENDYIIHDASTGAAKFKIQKEASVELSEAKSQFELVKKRIEENPTLSSLKEVQTSFPTGLAGLKVDEAADLSKALKSSAAGIQQEITLEQERRKAKEKK